jgi:hypothetical protein
MNLKNSYRLVIKVIVSLAFAGVFYTFWMAVAISVFKSGEHSSVLDAVLWLSAPAITAAGFAAGIAIFDRLSRSRKPGFLNAFKWSFIGCPVGAAAVFPFGPMLIVFGIFGVGTAAITLRETLTQNQSRH